MELENLNIDIESVIAKITKSTKEGKIFFKGADFIKQQPVQDFIRELSESSFTESIVAKQMQSKQK